MHCRGHRTREDIVNKYSLRPLAHIKLLAGQSKKSDTGNVITDQYYEFLATNKNNPNDQDIIQCGMEAAKDFLNLTKQQSLPIFNPLHALNNGNNNGGYNNGSQRITWDPVAKQLYNAIMWIIIIWDAKPKVDSPLFQIKATVENYKTKCPFDREIKAVNTIIKNGNHGKTLGDSINNLKQNNNIRNGVCDFTLLINKIKQMKDKNENLLNIKSWF